MKKLLIVEDEPDMCLLLNILLEGRDIELEHVKSISSASSYLASYQPSVVILDNKLPDGFGVDYIPELKKTYPDLKIIMISGFAGAVKDLALENGADVFLNKPFTRDEIFQSIKALI